MRLPIGLVRVGQAIVRHSPAILTGLGIIGLVSAGVSAVKNTPKALDILKEAEERVDTETPLKPVEKVKLCWKQYAFPVIIAVLSIACIIFARRIDSGRTAALLTACKVTEEAADRFDSTTKEVIGDKKYEEIKHKIAEKDIQDSMYCEGNVINTRTGNTLYFEPFSNQYLRASRDFIDKSMNLFNQKLSDYESMSINDYLDCFQLPKLDPRTTGNLEWQLDMIKKEIGRLPELIFDYFEIETGEVCGYFRPEIDPKSPKLHEYS